MATGTIYAAIGLGGLLAVAGMPAEGAATDLPTSGIHVQDSSANRALLRDLNKYLSRVSSTNLSYETIFDAYLDMTPPAMPVGEFFNQTTVWPGMADWSSVSDWAKSNASMAEALKVNTALTELDLHCAC